MCEESRPHPSPSLAPPSSPTSYSPPSPPRMPSGLDSFSALSVSAYLRALADVGHTLLVSIHQPRAAIWEMFDRVSVKKDGRGWCEWIPRAAIWEMCDRMRLGMEGSATTCW